MAARLPIEVSDMTEDERAAGRWQGGIEARVVSVERSTDALPKMRERLTKLESRMSIISAGLAAVVAAIAGAIFKIWAEGGF